MAPSCAPRVVPARWQRGGYPYWKQPRASGYRVDPVTTDAERTVWDVPPLAEALARAEEMNQADGPG
ncbi:hypothetical protein [Nonomuraea sp. NPDC052265]|uniref:hypothetical protein n=1 Tax=Nonomuraea sp. NPDC052265 TaxID=3364374 RepID=UPI0037C533D1